MKTRKILGIVILTLVLIFAMGALAYAAEVSDEAGLREAIQTLSTDSANPTEIILISDIVLDDGAGTAEDFTDGIITIAGVKGTPVYVNISGGSIINKQDLKANALFDISYAVVNIKDTVIDVNYGNDGAGEIETDYYAGGFDIKNSSTVSLMGDATIKNGYVVDIGASAAYISNSKFTIADNVKIINNQIEYDRAITKPLFYIEGTGSFTMSGGEVSGNKARNFIQHGDGDVKITLSDGKFENNTLKSDWCNTPARGSVYIGSVNIASGQNSAVSVGSAQKAINVTAPLISKINFVGSPAYTGASYLGEVYYPFVGSGYTLTLADFRNMGFNSHASRTQALDTANNRVLSSDTSRNPFPTGVILQDGTVVGAETPAIPDSVTESTDANGETRELSATETVTIAKSNLLKNATIDATNGKVVIGTTTITGIMSFDDEGNMVVSEGNKVTMETAGNGTVKSVGIVCSEKYDTAADTRTLTITTANGTFTDVYNTANITGNFLFNAIINNVPVATDAASFAVKIN